MSDFEGKSFIWLWSLQQQLWLHARGFQMFIFILHNIPLYLRPNQITFSLHFRGLQQLQMCGWSCFMDIPGLNYHSPALSFGLHISQFWNGCETRILILKMCIFTFLLFSWTALELELAVLGSLSKFLDWMEVSSTAVNLKLCQWDQVRPSPRLTFAF